MTRRVEILVCVSHGSDSGEWYTEYVEIPFGIPEELIEIVALDRWDEEEKSYIDERNGWVVHRAIYHIPPLDDGEEDDEE